MAKAPVMRLTALRTASSRGSEGEELGGLSRTAWDSLVSAASVVMVAGGEVCGGTGAASGVVITGASAVWLAADLELVLDEVGDDLGVGFGEELVALGDEGVFEGEVVFDDAVVHDDEGAGAVAVGVGVFFGGAAVGGPAGVADAVGAVDGVVAEDGVEVAELAGGAAELEALAVPWVPPATAMPAES